MFSNVAMNPYGPGGSSVTAHSPRGGQPGQDPRSASPGEAGAAGTRPEAAERVDPPPQPATAAALPQEDRREGMGPGPRAEAAVFGTRFTPMPFPPAGKSGTENAGKGDAGDAPRDAPVDAPVDATAGPPPAFRRSLLDAQRAETAAPDSSPSTISAPEPPAPTPEAAVSGPVRGGAVEVDGLAPSIRPSSAAVGTAGGQPDETSDTPVDPASNTPPDDDPLRAAIRQLVAESARPEVPPSAEERAEVEFTSLRRMDAPYDTATVDVLR
ncbi:hypothetical protein ACRDNQ_12940 [Palleronia sp. KMU-117]|uniref:hypothetical protein n=1 Tax=Palleronia sp. KMU-117 TaxID=3434108 RepID=UPI003D75C3E7